MHFFFIMLYEEGFTQNREISLLRYIERILEEALDENVPLFERLVFLDIFDSNLEEFFKVRVGGLLDETEYHKSDIDKKSGMSAGKRLTMIRSMVPGLLIRKDMTYSLIERELCSKGIKRLEPTDLNDEERGKCFDYFRDSIKHSLSINICGPYDDIPVIDEDHLYLAADLDAELEDHFGLIQIPDEISKVFVLGCSEDNTEFRYILTEDIIKMFSDTLFVPFVPREIHIIDITRNNASSTDSDRANTPQELLELVKKREKAQVDRLISDGPLTDCLKYYLCEKLGIDDHQVYAATRVSMSYIYELAELIPDPLRNGLFYVHHIPNDQTLKLKSDVIPMIKSKDIISAYPYDSMDLFLSLLREASFAEDVKEIRITIYRLSENPKIAEYLIFAARTGKKVSVVLELRARSDEMNNLAWTNRLTAAGCFVYNGTELYKVHSKMCQIVFENNNNEKEYITQISTGNYNEKTASQYADISLITSNREIGKAVSRLFRDICKDRVDKEFDQLKDRYYPLLVAPVSMRNKLEELIDRERAKGKDGSILIKANSITDKRIIEKLMEASCAGCQVRLIIRSVCCILPGIEGCTENVCTVSLVGRFLEHSRVYLFGSDDDEVIYISSADIMNRNLDRRIELACPINDKKSIKRIKEILYLNYNDTVKGRVMMQDGTYALKPGEQEIDSQMILSNLT